MVSSVSSPPPVQHQQPAQAPSKKSAPPKQPTDTVQLSQQAAAKLQSGDVDHDGDSH